MTIQTLNDSFGIDKHIHFHLGRGDLPVAMLENKFGTATVCLCGAQVLSYEPTNHDPVIWVSRYTNYGEGKVIRGGIPVIFPWFGPHPTDDEKYAHGFARRQLWDVKKTEQDDDGRTRITMTLHDNDTTRAVWPHAFELCLTVTLGEKLNVSMAYKNLGTESFTVTDALHTYFPVADSTKIKVRGLENVHYLDQLDGFKRKYRPNPIGIWEEVDRIYINSEEQCDIVDPVKGRTIHVAKSGSRSTVVWNPWVDKAARMTDLGDEEYWEFICVESGNVKQNAITLAPNESHETRQTIWIT